MYGSAWGMMRKMSANTLYFPEKYRNLHLSKEKSKI